MNELNHFKNSYTAPAQLNFTIIQNDLIYNADLSCKAFKLLCLGLSHSGKWIFRKSQIKKSFKEGTHTLNEAMKELKGLGYLHIVPRKNNSKGLFEGHCWYWFREPVSQEEFKKRFRNTDIPDLREKENSKKDSEVSNFSDSDDRTLFTRPKKNKTNKATTTNIKEAYEEKEQENSSSSFEESKDSDLEKKLKMLEGYDLNESTKRRLASYPLEDLEATLKHAETTEEEKGGGWLMNCIKEHWWLNKAGSSKLEEVNKERTLKALSELDGKKVGKLQLVKLEITHKGVRFMTVQKEKEFLYSENNYIAKVNKYLEEIQSLKRINSMPI